MEAGRRGCWEAMRLVGWVLDCSEKRLGAKAVALANATYDTGCLLNGID